MAVQPPTGFDVYRDHVRRDWIDLNDHMNVAYYVLAFDYAIDSLWERFGLTRERIEAERQSTFAVESHVVYKRELTIDEAFIVTSQILAFDAKRVHQMQRMYQAEDGFLAATAEWLHVHVDLRERRVSPWPDDVLPRIREAAIAQPESTYPADAGRIIRIREPLFTLAEADA